MFLSKHSLVLPLLLGTAASPVVSAVKAFETNDELRTVASAVKAFETKFELQNAVDSYCAAPDSYDTDTYGSINDWDVSKITNMYGLFRDVMPCNPNIGSWDVSKVTDFSFMFSAENSISANNFNQDISNWDVSSGTKFESVFYGAKAFNQDISNWDVSRGTSFFAMFAVANVFNQDISNWDVSSGTDFGAMFYDANVFDQDISNWDVSSGTNFYWMFQYANVFNQDISNWDVSNGTEFGEMFYSARAFNQPLLYCKWQTNSIFKNTTPNPCEGSKSCGWGDTCFFFKCVDSPLQFQVETVGGSLLPFSCKLAVQNKNKVTCSNQGQVATHCPKVCGECSEYECSDSEGVFFMGNGKKRECSWLKQMGESKRIKKCKKPKVAKTCRETCKFCE